MNARDGYALTKDEQRLMAEAPTTASAPRGVAGCGRRGFMGYVCTLMAGHLGPHIAHGVAGIPCRCWRDETPIEETIQAS